MRAERSNLAVVRAGEYEGLRDKVARSEGKPDFGPGTFNAKSGATAVGARDFLVAYNINLNTTSTRRANAIAFDVREKGRIEREGDSLTGEIVRDADGQPVWTPGSLESVKGIGWYIEEYGIAQVSLNLTNLSVTPIHIAFDEVCAKAAARGVRVTGSELVGLVPLQAMLDAGRYFLKKQHRSVGIADWKIIKIAARSLGLDDLYPFRTDEKIIEYAMAATDRSESEAASEPIERGLVGRTVRRFVEETASESVAPGGGSVSAAVGALGAALGTMVANLSSHKRGWDERWEEFSNWAERGKRLHDELLRLIDADTEAFNEVMAAFKLPEGTDEERSSRAAAVEAATKRAIEVPLLVMEAALASMEITGRMADIGLPSSASDAGVGALCARAAVRGAYLNVRINAKDLTDRAYVDDVLGRGGEMVARAEELERETLALLDGKM